MSIASLSSRVLLLVVLAGVLCSLDPAWAQTVGGLERVNTFVESVLAVLRGISVGVATIAIIWAGYKFFFQRADLSEVLYILGGGLLVGGAAEIARYLVGTTA
jgi:type IV secretion system protein VirB2/type IV secretion system protein PtlA